MACVGRFASSGEAIPRDGSTGCGRVWGGLERRVAFAALIRGHARYRLRWRIGQAREPDTARQCTDSTDHPGRTDTSAAIEIPSSTGCAGASAGIESRIRRVNALIRRLIRTELTHPPRCRNGSGGHRIMSDDERSPQVVRPARLERPSAHRLAITTTRLVHPDDARLRHRRTMVAVPIPDAPSWNPPTSRPRSARCRSAR
ncbi:hypothetical protein BLA9940_01552 [Burkholderia aenigmatica]|nr:hypothetical protein BLA9940_01552 [Burkholderia aenigmatica]